MPEQQSSRGNPTTPAPIEAPFETILLPYGNASWNLQDDLITLPPGAFPRLTNLENEQNGELHPRPGQTAFASAGTLHHSVRLLRDPQVSNLTRIWGVDSQLYLGTSGVLTQIDTGYSGDPLTLLPHRPTLSGDPWMFVADRQRMRKVRFDGTDLPIGLPPPATAPSSVLVPEQRTTICAFDPGIDGTASPTWTGTAGQYFGVVTPRLMNPPFAFDTTAFGTSDAVNFRCVTNPTVDSGATGYDSWWGRALVKNLDLVGGIAASDDDLIHLGIKFSHPLYTAECRIYLVCSVVFDPTILPGTSYTVNTDFYVKTFKQDDFAPFIQRLESQFEASERARVRTLRDSSILTGRVAVPRDPNTQGAARLLAAGSSPGVAWYQTGIVGVPLRRSEWQRIGNESSRGWGTITGIIVYLKAQFTPPSNEPNTVNIEVALADMYLTGGYGPDSSEAGGQPYDYRITDYDPRSGAESNPSPEMAEAVKLDALRRAIVVTPAAPAGDSALRQRFYRRGGSLSDDWFYAGQNTTDGGSFTDSETDDGIAAAGSLSLDHFQPVPTINDTGATVLAQAVPALWGPLGGMLFACGDPYRPGHLYYSLPDQPDHWSASGNVEVCAPSEELQNGGIYGSQGFVFSRRSLYLIYAGLNAEGSVTITPTQVKRGLWARWAFAIGPGGIYYMAEDGIFLTGGGPEEWLSRDLDPLFRGETVHGYLPIDKAVAVALRMTIWQNKLYFQYQDTGGGRQCAIFDCLTRKWRHYTFGRAHAVLQGEDETTLLIGGLNQGQTYRHTGFSDDGLAIPWVVRSGALSNNRREEKLFGDQALLADRQGVTIYLQNFLNEEAVENPPQLVAEGEGRQNYILDSFGEVPQRARSISTAVFGESMTARPILVSLGTAITLQPEITSDRVTTWDDLGHPDEKWVSGVTFDVDTFGADRTILIERDFAGARTTITTLTVNTNTRHKVTFSWPAVPANMVRVRPSDECKFWVLYRADWIALPEPPRISQWDIHFENAWDQYYTGLDLYCDTSGAEKRLEVYVDEVLLTNPFTGLSYFPVIANGRKVVHLTFEAGRGHVFRFRAIDANPGLLYTHRWHLQEEPSEQANWNQNFSIFGTRADKWLKAIIFECDTFDANKTVRVEVDGQTVETLTVRANGRSVIQLPLTEEKLGRVWRMYPADGNPGRLYSVQPIFDEEPFCLDRWETQETNHGMPGWFFLTSGHVTLKAERDVFLTVTMTVNQELGTTVEKTYTIPHTHAQKVRRFVTFYAIKGVLVKYRLTSTQPFWLYQEESNLLITPWGGTPQLVQPFGNANSDPTRRMVRSELAAATPGGGT